MGLIQRRAANRTGAGMAALFAALALLPSTAGAFTLSRQLGNHEYYAELVDAYYIATGLYFSLSNAPIPAIDRSELATYRYLLRNALRPNSLLIELGGYPLQCAGAALRKWAPTYYERADLGWIHLVQAVTASVNFPEPWSVSLFLGHVGRFLGPDSLVEGHGQIGLLASYGNYHIHRDIIYVDHWAECELKLKVDKRGRDRKYATSYRVGVRLHGLDNVKHQWYVCLRRDRTVFNEARISLIRNTNFELRADFAFAPADLLTLTVEAGKKYPISLRRTGKKLVLGLSFGGSLEINNAYRGALGEGFEKNRIGVILRPLVQF